MSECTIIYMVNSNNKDSCQTNVLQAFAHRTRTNDERIFDISPASFFDAPAAAADRAVCPSYLRPPDRGTCSGWQSQIS